MFKKNFVAASLSAACLFTCVGAYAQSYVGATIGKASWSANCAPGGYACSQNTGNTAAFQILGGYEFSRHWGVEASYYDLGKITDNNYNYYYADKVELKSSGVDIAAVARFPFGTSGLEGFIKMGAITGASFSSVVPLRSAQATTLLNT